MHLVISYAGLGELGVAPSAFATALPHLSALLQRARAEPVAPSFVSSSGDDESEEALATPLEAAMAPSFGLPAPTAKAPGLPWAAAGACFDGVPAELGESLAVITPCHWRLGTDRAHLDDPRSLGLSETEAREFFDLLRSLTQGEGFQLYEASPARCYLAHEHLHLLPTRSPELAVGRSMTAWALGPNSAGEARALAKRLARLQSEWQMLLHEHPLNLDRQARGLSAVNSFWLSGTGLLPEGHAWQGRRTQPTPEREPKVAVAGVALPLPRNTQWVDELREPWLHRDGQAWLRAWQAIDAGPVRELLLGAAGTEPKRLTLAGTAQARSWQIRPERGLRAWLGQKLRARVDVGQLLEAL